MPRRQPQGGKKAFILGSDTYSKLVKLIKKRDPSTQTGSDNDTNIITVTNDSSQYLNAYEAVEIKGLTIEDEDDPDFFDLDAFNVDVPSANAKTLAVLLEPLEVGASGEAIISGLTTCNVDVKNVDHRFAKSVGSPILESSEAGPVEIKHPPAQTGQQHVKVVLSSTPQSLHPVATASFGTQFPKPTYDGFAQSLSSVVGWFGNAANNRDTFDLSNSRIRLKNPGWYLVEIYGEIKYQITYQQVVRNKAHTLPNFVSSVVAPDSTVSGVVNFPADEFLNEYPVLTTGHFHSFGGGIVGNLGTDQIPPVLTIQDRPDGFAWAVQNTNSLGGSIGFRANFLSHGRKVNEDVNNEHLKSIGSTVRIETDLTVAGLVVGNSEFPLPDLSYTDSPSEGNTNPANPGGIVNQPIQDVVIPFNFHSLVQTQTSNELINMTVTATVFEEDDITSPNLIVQGRGTISQLGKHGDVFFT